MEGVESPESGSDTSESEGGSPPPGAPEPMDQDNADGNTVLFIAILINSTSNT